MTVPLAVVGLAFPWLPLRYTPWLDLPADAGASLIFLGILGVAIAQWFWQIGISRLGAARAGLFLYLEPLATTALAVPYLGESFGLTSAIGGLLVLCGVFVGARKPERR
jgi:drug/metabolite transporter (DMT)-like permease